MLDKKTNKEIGILREGGLILGQILQTVSQQVKVGMTGLELDQQVEKLMRQAGGQPSFKGYRDFPNALCVSVNQTVVHGIPNSTPFQNGDLVGLDAGLKYKGLYTDAALTVPVGQISPEAIQLLKVTKQALAIGISQVSPNNCIGDIGQAIEKYVQPFGYGIIKDLAGHGVGRKVHEDPFVPNYNTGKSLAKMFPGLVLAIEPMLILGGTDQIVIGDNGWDALSADQSLTAHFEHTVVVTEDGYLILTAVN